MRALRPEAGTTTFSCLADDALRMRVNMSAMGSVMDIGEVSYQLDLMTPVISPCSARLRKQMRHIWNLRRNARGRPQSSQRLYCRTRYFSLRFACAIFEGFATRFSSRRSRLLAERHAERTQQRAAFLV